MPTYARSPVAHVAAAAAGIGPTRRRVAEAATATRDRVGEAVSDKPWSDFSQADYDIKQWRRACLVDTGEGDEDSKARYRLPVREPDGTLNRNGCHAAAARINQLDVPAAKKKAAARKLVGLYRSQLDEEPPESLTDFASEADRGSGTSRRTAVREIAELLDRPGNTGTFRIRLIRAGWSLNNVYWSAEVLRRDGPRAWAKGTQAFADHATDAEEEARPGGSIRDLAGVLVSDPVWNEAEQALEADVRVFAPWREALADMAEHIGMSIRAWVYAEDGEAEGRQGMVVTSIPEGRSVDFVTQPAAGGAILSVLESVQRRMAREGRNCGHWFEAQIHSGFTTTADRMFGEGYLTRAERITLSSAVGDALAAFATRVEQDAPHLYTRDPYRSPDADAPTPADEARRVAEATAQETRDALDAALREAYGAEDTYVWVQDWDTDAGLVWYQVSGPDEVHTWQEGFTVADGRVELAGERTEVRARTVYDPVADGSDADDVGDAAESTHPSTVATPVAEDVTDGAPPTAPNPPTEEEPVSGTQTGAPPVQAGTATVADTPPATTAAPPQTTTCTTTNAAAEAQQPLRTDPQVTAALESITQQLGEMQQRLAAETARADQRDAENRALRNTNRASEAVAAALRAPEVADVVAQIGARVSARVLAAVPTTAEGAVDETKLGEAITAAITDEAGYVRGLRAAALEEAGVGLPRGLGAAPATEADDGFDAELGEFFTGVLGLSAEASKIATKGRVS